MLDLNKIYCGDCLEVMKDIDDNSIDMILCDLPYGITDCKWDVVIPFDILWDEYSRVLKENTAILLFGTEPFSSYARMSNISNYKYDWIWDKAKPTGFQLVKYRPMQQHEEILVFSKGKLPYYPVMTPRDSPRTYKHYKSSGVSPLSNDDMKERVIEYYYPKSILYYSNADNTERFHPTQKPTRLCKYLIETYTQETEIILDNCCGSGSTCVAAKQSNRKFIGIDTSEKYCEIARERLKQSTLFSP